MTGFDPMSDSGSIEEVPSQSLKANKALLKARDVQQFTVGADDDAIRLDRRFKRHMPDLPFTQISRWARTGQIRVDGKRVKPGDQIEAGQVIRVPPAEQAKEGTSSRARPRVELTEDQIAFARDMVIHRDKAAVVVNKPPGLATQGGSKTHEHLDGLLDALQYDAGARPRLVHRLDKDTSGVVLLARSAGSAAFFSKQFSGRSARKVYWALIMGIPDIADGIIELPIGKQPGTGGEKMQVDEENGQTAKTRYRIIDRAGNSTCWVELQPYTGRTHQLRVHMAAIGHPIVGDGKYGGKEAFLSGVISRKMHLHARRLRIEHPDSGILDIRADLPEHFANSMAHLGFEIAMGDELVLDDGRAPPDKTIRKKMAKAHSKTMRKEKRGERRARGDKRAETTKPGNKPPKAKARTGRPTTSKAGPPKGGPRTR